MIAIAIAAASLCTQVDSLYYSTTTMKTIGFGDIVPKTYWGRVSGAIFALIAPAVSAIMIVQVAIWKIQAVQQLLKSRAPSSWMVKLFTSSRNELALSLLALYVLLGTLLFHLIERLDYLPAFELMVSIITTVGWGHVYPTTSAGKIVVIILSIAANGITAVVVETVGTQVIDMVAKVHPGGKRVRKAIPEI